MEFLEPLSCTSDERGLGPDLGRPGVPRCEGVDARWLTACSLAQGIRSLLTSESRVWLVPGNPFHPLV